MSTYFEDIIRLKSEHLADLKKTTAEIEREISNARDGLEREFSRSRAGQAAEAGFPGEACQCEDCQPQQARVPSPRRPAYAAPRLDFDFAPGQAEPGETDRFDVGWYAADLARAEPDAAGADPDADRTTILINKGRSSAHRRKLAVSRKLVIAAIAGVTLLVLLILLLTSGPGASWPTSVARVQGWMEQACRNPNVMSEPGQVNFACAKGTRQILWVFALITSENNPSFADTKTGRQGLEPITPGQGGQVAAALNLHHPYDPSNPLDSIQVDRKSVV